MILKIPKYSTNAYNVSTNYEANTNILFGVLSSLTIGARATNKFTFS